MCDNECSRSSETDTITLLPEEGVELFSIFELFRPVQSEERPGWTATRQSGTATDRLTDGLRMPTGGSDYEC